MTRGCVYWVDLGYGRKPFLVVSNNKRNKAWDDVLAARITTTPPASRGATVPLGTGDPLVGWVVCDNIETISEEDAPQLAGSASPRTLQAVEQGLKAAFALR